jgi:processive 1,2-diacylglycerol beta-glucosyltransferase
MVVQHAARWKATPVWPSRQNGQNGSGLVHVVTGSFGAGHDSAAREIAIRFEERGYLTRTWDIVDLFPAGLGTALRACYVRQLKTAPGSWGLLLEHSQPGRLAHQLVGQLMTLTHRRLAEVAAGEPDVIVSTHPFASQALGQMRASGALSVPVVTYLTDMSVHPLWVHPAVDLHLALGTVAAAQARRWHGTTTVIKPLVPRVFGAPRVRGAWPAELTSRLGVPAGTPLALVVGGSLGIGDLERTASDIAETGTAHPVVLCGTNRALFDRLGSRAGISRLGWRDDVPALLRTVDCVVQNSGGFLSLEALAAGTPCISYRSLPGHGRTNAAALDLEGLIPWARDVHELRTELTRALAGSAAGSRPGRTSPPSGSSDVVDAVFPERARVPA